MLPRLERRSVLTGALATIVLAVPPAVIGLLVSEDDTMEGSSWVPFLFFWITVAFFVGGLVAARAQPHAPLAHGAAAALLGYLLVQGVGLVRHLNSGEDLSWLSIAFSALLSASIGTIGGMVADRLRVRRSRTAP